MIEEGVIGSIHAYPKQTLDEVANDYDISPSKVKGIFDSHLIHYYNQTPVVGLDQNHKDQRLLFCNQLNNVKYKNMSKIIFTDEKSGGIRCQRGLHYEDEFYVKNIVG